jgi:hypothetical protein
VADCVSVTTSRRPRAQHGNDQAVPVEQGPPAPRHVSRGLGPLHEKGCQIKQLLDGEKPRAIIAGGCRHAFKPSLNASQPCPVGSRRHHRRCANELEQGGGGARMIADAAQLAHVGFHTSATDPGRRGFA